MISWKNIFSDYNRKDGGFNKLDGETYETGDMLINKFKGCTHLWDMIDWNKWWFYNHYDGYPSGLGVTLADYLQDFKVVNGLGSRQGKVANGMGCLAAQTVKYFKDEPGQIYLQKPRNMDWEEYEYFIWCKDGHGVWISIFDYEGECIFVGKSSDLINKYQEQ